MHILFTGPRGEGHKVMGKRELLLVQTGLVGEEKGNGVKDKLGTAVSTDVLGTVDRVGDRLGEGEVLGEGPGTRYHSGRSYLVCLPTCEPTAKGSDGCICGISQAQVFQALAGMVSMQTPLASLYLNL